MHVFPGVEFVKMLGKSLEVLIGFWKLSLLRVGVIILSLVSFKNVRQRGNSLVCLADSA